MTVRAAIRPIRWLLAVWAGGVATAVPVVASACPMCAGQPDPGYGKQIAVGLMVASPYVVVGTVLFVLIRRILKANQTEGHQR